MWGWIAGCGWGRGTGRPTPCCCLMSCHSTSPYVGWGIISSRSARRAGWRSLAPDKAEHMHVYLYCAQVAYRQLGMSMVCLATEG